MKEYIDYLEKASKNVSSDTLVGEWHMYERDVDSGDLNILNTDRNVERKIPKNTLSKRDQLIAIEDGIKHMYNDTPEVSSLIDLLISYNEKLDTIDSKRAYVVIDDDGAVVEFVTSENPRFNPFGVSQRKDTVRPVKLRAVDV